MLFVAFLYDQGQRGRRNTNPFQVCRRVRRRRIVIVMILARNALGALAHVVGMLHRLQGTWTRGSLPVAIIVHNTVGELAIPGGS